MWNATSTVKVISSASRRTLSVLFSLSPSLSAELCTRSCPVVILCAAADTFSLFDKMKFYGVRDEQLRRIAEGRKTARAASSGQKLKQSGYEFSGSTKTKQGRERERDTGERESAACPLCSLGLVSVPRQIKQTNKQTTRRQRQRARPRRRQTTWERSVREERKVAGKLWG